MKLSWRRRTIRLRHRFATSQGGVSEKQVIHVELEHEGLTGTGEVVPSRLYGQSLESSEAALEDMARHLGSDPFAIGAILGGALQRHDAQRAAVTGLDNALYDWVARKLEVPLYRLLGLQAPRVITTFTIGLAGLEETRAKVEEALAAGYTALKVKIGGPHDLQTLAMIRTRFDGPLLLDANEAWSPEEAPERVRALAEFRPAMIEQPVGQDLWQHMRPLRELGIAPIFADESCRRPADVVRLRDCVDGVNIKFTKCGGVREALRMIDLARTLGLKVMVGCFVSTSLAVAPALAIAQLADFADLDGHLLLAADPFEGIVRDGSTLSLGDKPGLGVEERS